MSEPSISVVIPAYNARSTIERSLQSVANQSLKATEVIVIDDASTDDTIAKVREFSTTSEMIIRILQSEQNAGPGSARNRGWDNSTGEFIAFLDADDVWHPQKLEIQVREMRRNRSFVMSCHERIVSASHMFPGIDETKVLTRE